MTLVCGLQRTVSSSGSSTIRSSSVSSSSSVTRRSHATSATSSRQTKQASSSSVTEVKRALQSCSIQDNIGGRGRYSVNIQFNGDNNVKRIKIVWQSVKHVHFWQNSHNILAITKSPVSVLIIYLILLKCTSEYCTNSRDISLIPLDAGDVGPRALRPPAAASRRGSTGSTASSLSSRASSSTSSASATSGPGRRPRHSLSSLSSAASSRSQVQAGDEISQ